MSSERQRMLVLYSGHVQGVGFRHAACQVAAGFDVCGTVRNLPDGRVELVAEGDRHELQAFLQAIRDHGLQPLIRDESIHWSVPHGNLRSFQVVRT